MILNQLTLTNFCIYHGEHVFDLAPGRRGGRPTPIVLFGGINGGGKTTLLDAVQLVLYGKRSRCSKRGDKAYDRFLLDSINHDVDPSEGASIRLSFQYAADGKEQLYEVTRSWGVARENVRDRVQVCRDGEVDGWLSENWNQLVEDLIPFGIAQLCFFDAEKIRFLAEDETSTQALGEAIKSLLGLDLAERLLADASVLEARLAKRATKSKDLEELERLNNELGLKQAEVTRLKEDRAGVAPLQERAASRIQAAEEQFARVGGKHWEQREERQRQRGELENTVRDTEEQLVGLAASELPMAMVADLLTDMATQARQERAAGESEIVSQLLTKRDRSLMAALKKKRASAKAIETVRDHLQSDRNARNKLSGIDCWLELPDVSQRRLEHLLEDGLPRRLEESASLLEQLESGCRELETVQRSLAAAPKDDSISEIATELKAATSEMAGFDQQINRIDKQLTSVQFEQSELQKQASKLRRKVVDEEIGSEEGVRIARLLVRTQDSMSEFLRRVTAKKIDRLSQFVTDSFRFLLRKKSLVERVIIDPESFSITILDTAGNSVPKDRLSEGEKQIFAISVLWGLSKASLRPLPVIIDTPMGRLDAEHRTQLVQRYFPHASHQVIVLSTDTEIEREFFQQLQPQIARAYHLKYDEQRRVTEAEEGYFWDAEPVAKLEEVQV
jgi:DNA sulfur modification protein DndD